MGYNVFKSIIPKEIQSDVNGITGVAVRNVAGEYSNGEKNTH